MTEMTKGESDAWLRGFAAALANYLRAHHDYYGVSHVVEFRLAEFEAAGVEEVDLREIRKAVAKGAHRDDVAASGEYEHTGAPPCRGYKGRRVRIIESDATRVTYQVTRPVPGYQRTSRIITADATRFFAQYVAVPS